ncbi:NAD-dependent dehydratase [candidate division WOR-1 bacterium RIFOXYD2_FULL_36_8]|uniref:UDP-glucuronate decarboxylase n=1 Tax=candidate division WOR-1 bacterium RIFOXYB2_FULL_36_35 TaxID=1802578 RepID=A0A1F4S3U5_UNCSA|nr:MAG: NAD-dependent dehydratase [candidate division WOR-1 bacterium RIFOXYA2_FULL_36_21]OGC14211.1 MAG: NAD-dependent dehydratase [candidate division WOR-1 bacterium RIFOXYA12_FULL_36_13]OGC15111.1 MAG: NAD-dependent dehydratase [candidate division WOR-1 bacterium RIFOXYB2_FULL_36_35]OGC37960.1 MAG: NAD-dependent dehydratase [candidate division WOR-1 bacterium RIFOXYD2_FULL_36_8]
MKILITGGAGFIASHLIDLLLQEDHEVVCIDNLITGSLHNIKHHEGNKNLKFIEHDISTHLDYKDRIDFVLHMASPASPVDYMELPIETLEVGALGTFNALELAKEKGAKYLFASTSEIYGDPLVSPQKEEYWGNVNSIGPRSVYDEAKRFAEATTMAYLRHYSLDTRIIRIFNTYGPRMRKNDGRVVPNFINQALNNKPFTIYGDGKQTRSFCYVSDLVSGIYKVMQSDIHTPINLGNPNEFTMIELAQVVSKIIGGSLKTINEPLPQDDPKQRRPDISKAKKELKWEPVVQLEEGLKKTIEWFKNGR